MFEQEFHQKIYLVLHSLNPNFFAACHAYFGGGTLVSLKHGEHRLSKDIDFICPVGSGGYRLLRQEIANQGYNAIFRSFDRIRLPRDIQANQYGVRFPLLVDGTQIKLEIIAEARILLGIPDYPSWSPVPCLNETDCFAEKLLSNSDRWLDASVQSRDLIDLSMQRLAAAIPSEAIDKAENAYPVIEPLQRAIRYFQTHPDYRQKCFQSLRVAAPERIVDGLDLLAKDFGIEATTRLVNEINWERLGIEEAPRVDENSNSIEAASSETLEISWDHQPGQNFDSLQTIEPVETGIQSNYTHLDQQEALATAAAVQVMLSHLGEQQPDRSISFESQNFLFLQRQDVVTIAAKQDSREVLRVEGDTVVVFSPTDDERSRLKNFREQVAIDFPDQPQERKRGRSL